MSDREDFERRAIAALLVARGGSYEPAWEPYVRAELSREVRAVLDVLGLTVETVWTDDGDPEVQRDTPTFSISHDPFDQEAAVAFFRQHGWKHKRRLVGEWETIEE